MRFLITLVSVPFLLSGCGGGVASRRMGEKASDQGGDSPVELRVDNVNLEPGETVTGPSDRANKSKGQTYAYRIMNDKNLDELRAEIRNDAAFASEKEKWILVNQIYKMESNALENLEANIYMS